MNYKHDIYRTKFRKEEILEPALGDDWLILDLGLLKCHCGARRIEKGILISKDILNLLQFSKQEKDQKDTRTYLIQMSFQTNFPPHILPLSLQDPPVKHISSQLSL